MRRRRGWGAVAVGACLATMGCAVAAGTPPGDVGPLPPPGYGTLRQDDVSIGFASGELDIKVTPLAEAVLVTTAPDTYRRLHGLAEAYGPRVEAPVGTRVSLFLVSFFSDAAGTTFVPEEVQIRALGQRLRPTDIVAVTPGWGQRRLDQRGTEMAVYAFPAVDLESDFTVLYGLVEAGGWTTILPRIQAERARARSRAPGA